MSGSPVESHDLDLMKKEERDDESSESFDRLIEDLGFKEKLDELSDLMKSANTYEKLLEIRDLITGLDDICYNCEDEDQLKEIIHSKLGEQK